MQYDQLGRPRIGASIKTLGIGGCATAFFLGVLFLVFGMSVNDCTGRTHKLAQDEANRYLQKTGLAANQGAVAVCVYSDSDGDKYVSCPYITKDGVTHPLECAGALTFNKGFGSHLRLPCNCILEVLCTMPLTYWVRVIRYEHRCPRHPLGGDHLLKHEPAWVTVDGQLIGRDLFSMTFHKLVSAYGVVLVSGFITNYGRTRLPSMLSLESTHWIIDTGQTESIPRNER